MKKMKRMEVALVATLAIMGSTVAFAEEDHPVTKTVTAQDGLITINLPNEKWYAITTAENVAEFSDGDCGIVLNVYNNKAEELPKITVADKIHSQVYETVGSTTEYIYTIVGLTNSAEDYAEVVEAVNSAKIDVSKITADMVGQKIAADEYTISAANYNAWVNANDGLNVRSGSSTEATLVTNLERGTKVSVTGVVLHNGIENGWVKIQVNGVEGYVSVQFLSTSEVGKTGTPDSDKNATKTKETKTLYFSDGSEVVVTKYSDETWRSESGIQYWGLTDYEWSNSNGNVLYVTKPNTNPASRTGNSMTLYHGNGNIEIIYEYTDGSWRDDTGIDYGGWPGDGYMTSASGEKLYTYDPVPVNTSDEDQNIILNGENGEQTVIYDDGAEDGSWTDNAKRYYRYNAFGTWICDGVYYYEQQ